jgi:predicted enzyme related to lactoylglutathione lyase
MTIGMVGLTVNDPIAAFRFYTETLGFKERQYLPEMRLAVVMAAEGPGETSLLLGPDDNPIAKNFQTGLYNAGIPAMVMMSKDIQKEYEELVAKGVIFKKSPEKTPWGTQALFDDTCGNWIQLHQL